MQDPKVLLVEFIKANFSSSNPTAAQLSGSIYTNPSERTFRVPCITVGPMPAGPDTWLSGFQHWYKAPVPIIAYALYDMNALNTITAETNAKIQRWNMIDSVRTMIDGNKNLSGGTNIQLAINKGTPKELTLTKWRPPCLGLVSIVEVQWVDDITRSGTIP